MNLRSGEVCERDDVVGNDLAVGFGWVGRRDTLGKAVSLDFHWGLLITTLKLFLPGQSHSPTALGFRDGPS